MHRAEEAPNSRNFLTWSASQLLQFLRLIAQMVVVGVVLAMLRRQFHWRAFLAGAAVMLCGVLVWAPLVYYGPAWLAPQRDVALWCGVMGVMAAGGWVVGRVGRRVGFWECYLATLVLLGAVGLFLTQGWHGLFAATPAETSNITELVESVPPHLGVQYLGPMWDRLLALGAVAGFLTAVLGGSLAFVLYADAGRRDSGFDVEWMVAVRHLGGRRGFVSITAVVAVLGIALGVAALIAVTAVMSGYQEDIQTKILSTNAHLVVQKYGIDFTEYERVAAAGVQVPGVRAASPFTFSEAMLSSDGLGMGVLLKGVLPQEAAQVTGIERNLCRPIANGSCVPWPAAERAGMLAQLLAPDQAVPSIVLGVELFKKLARPLGSTLLLTTPVGIAGAPGNAPRRMEFRISGVFRSGMHEFDARLAYLDLAASQQLLGMGDAVNGVEFRVDQPEQVEKVAAEVLLALGRWPYRTFDWRELNASIFTALKLQKIVMFLVLTFIVIVASFNIASTLFMAVVEKAREIAILKSMGARDGTVMKLFLLQGWLTGGVGTAAGLLLGLAVAWMLGQMRIPIAADVYMVESLRVRIEPLEVALTVFAALAISHLATIYPALKAARQRPVDAMRYE